MSNITLTPEQLARRAKLIGIEDTRTNDIDGLTIGENEELLFSCPRADGMGDFLQRYWYKTRVNQSRHVKIM